MCETGTITTSKKKTSKKIKNKTRLQLCARVTTRPIKKNGASVLVGGGGNGSAIVLSIRAACLQKGDGSVWGPSTQWSKVVGARVLAFIHYYPSTKRGQRQIHWLGVSGPARNWSCEGCATALTP